MPDNAPAFVVNGLNVYYEDFQAIKRGFRHHSGEKNHRLNRPLGLRQVHFFCGA